MKTEKLRAVLLAVLVSALVPPQASARVIDVPGDYETITAGMEAARDGDEVAIAPGTWYESGLDFRGKRIVVRASSGPTEGLGLGEEPPVIIDGEGNGPIFLARQKEPEGAALQSLIIRNGLVEADRGAALEVENDATLWVQDCIFSKHGPVFDCANPDVVSPIVRVAGGRSVLLQNCTFLRNSMRTIFSHETDIRIERCTFTDNCGDRITAVQLSNASKVVIDQSVFLRNEFDPDQGAVLSVVSADTLLISDSIFRDNKGRNATAVNVHNTGWFEMTDTVIAGNQSRATNGGFLVNYTDSRWIGCRFENNTAKNIGGGGEFDAGAGYRSSNEVIDCVFSGNSAERGGGLFVDDGANVSIEGCRFEANHALTKGEDDEPGRGAAIFAHGAESHLVLEHCTFLHNRAPVGTGSAIYCSSAPVYVDHCTFLEHFSAAGDMLHTIGDGAAIEVESSIIRRTYPRALGGSSGQVMIRYSNVEGGAPGEGNIDEDPVFCSPECHPDRLGLAIDSPCAGTGYGGTDMGAYGVECVTPLNGPYSSLRVPRDISTIAEAVLWACNGDSVVLSPGTHRAEDVPFWGKALVLRSEDPHDLEIVESTVIAPDSIGGMIRLVHQEGPGTVITGLTFEGGLGGWDGEDYTGGAITCRDQASPTLIGLRFRGNRSAWNGGALFLDRSEARIVACLFEGNRAGLGGAIYAQGGAPQIQNCLFEDNTANAGAAICAQVGAEPQIGNCTFTQNAAEVRGGAFFLLGRAAAWIHGSILWNNTPDELYINGGSAFLRYCDVSGGWPGQGNIDAAPKFVGALGLTRLLGPNSPCIDASSGAADGIVWCDFSQRYCQRNTALPDIGAYGGPNADWWGDIAAGVCSERCGEAL